MPAERVRAARRNLIRSALAVSLLGAALAAAPAAPAAVRAPSATIDPALVAQVAKGPSIAIFNWDHRSTSRAEVAGFLAANGTEAHLFDSVSAGYTCAGGFGELTRLASIPGGLSVVADAPVETATDRSVSTAFNGNPAAIWSDPPAGLGLTGKGIAIGIVDTGLDASHPDLALRTAENPGGKTRVNVRVIFGHRDQLGPWTDPCVQDTYSDEPYPGVQFGNMTDTERLSGHGTHLAGVAAGSGTQDARYKGVAPGADLVAVGAVDSVNATVQVPNDNTRPSTLSVIAGLDYMASRFANTTDRGVNLRVVLAGWVLKGNYTPNHPLVSSLENLYSSNIVVVMPVGNEGPSPSDCSQGSSTCRFNEWASWSEYDDFLGNHYVSTPVVAVASSTRTSRRMLSQFSSKGDPVTRIWRDPSNSYERILHHEPTVTAPGSAVTSTRRLGTAGLVATDPVIGASAEKGSLTNTDRYYQTLSGTSVAAAHVAGAIALMQEAAVKAKGCYLTSDQVRTVLQSTATMMPGYGRHEVGAGMVDITAAVHYSRSIPARLLEDPWMCPGRP